MANHIPLSLFILYILIFHHAQCEVNSTCQIKLYDPEKHAQSVQEILDSAHEMKLIEFELDFKDYNSSDDPLAQILLKQNYKPHKWVRIYKDYGLVLLSLSFNYDVLSMMMLSYGVENVKVGSVVHYCRC